MLYTHTYTYIHTYIVNHPTHILWSRAMSQISSVYEYHYLISDHGSYFNYYSVQSWLRFTICTFIVTIHHLIKLLITFPCTYLIRVMLITSDLSVLSVSNIVHQYHGCVALVSTIATAQESFESDSRGPIYRP